MTESLADGPDWHLRSRFCSGLSLFSAVDIWEAAPQLLCTMDSILEDKELMKMHVDLQKRFPEKPCVSQMHGGPSLRRGDTNEGLNIPSGIGCVGNDTGRQVTWEFPLRTDSAS